jgi:hypothetical protein
MTFRNRLIFLGRGVVSPKPNPQAGRPLLAGCPQLLIKYIRSYPPYLEAVSSILNLRTSNTVVTIDPPIRETGWNGMDWIDLAQDRDQWTFVVNTVMNRRVP